MVFPKNTFQSVFTKSPPSPIFGAKQTMWHVSRQNFHERKLPSILPKAAPKLFFPKNTFPVRFYKTAPHLFSRPDGLCGAFRGKIVTDENFTRFCLKRPLNHFFENHVSCPFLRNRPPHLFLGPNRLCGAFRGKIFTDGFHLVPRIGEGAVL